MTNLSSPPSLPFLAPLSWAGPLLLAFAAACSSASPGSGTEPPPAPDAGTKDAAAPSACSPVPPSCSTTPSYANDVEPILQRSCLTCHSPGGDAADRDLTTPAHIMTIESLVSNDVSQCAMPPSGAPSSTNVSAADRATILQWLVCGGPNN